MGFFSCFFSKFFFWFFFFEKKNWKKMFEKKKYPQDIVSSRATMFFFVLFFQKKNIFFLQFFFLQKFTPEISYLLGRPWFTCFFFLFIFSFSYLWHALYLLLSIIRATPKTHGLLCLDAWFPRYGGFKKSENPAIQQSMQFGDITDSNMK